MSGLTIDPDNTAVLFTDPQVDALKPEGVMWNQVGDLVEEHDVVDCLATSSTSSALERPTNHMDGLGFGPLIYDELGRYARYWRLRIRGERLRDRGDKVN